MSMNDEKLPAAGVKPVWKTPKLQDLGNVRQFVQTGAANGKSGTKIDGDSMAGNETMN